MKQLKTRLEDDERAMLAEMAAQDGRSLNNMIRELIRLEHQRRRSERDTPARS